MTIHDILQVQIDQANTRESRGFVYALYTSDSGPFIAATRGGFGISYPLAFSASSDPVRAIDSALATCRTAIIRLEASAGELPHIGDHHP